MRISAAARSVGLVVAAIGVPLAGAGVIRLSRKACRAAEARKRHIVDLIRRNSGKDLSKGDAQPPALHPIHTRSD